MPDEQPRAESMDVKAFARLLFKSRLVDRYRIEKLRKADPGTPAEKLAPGLVERGWITAWQAQQLLAGHTDFFLGRYKLLEKLGQGGMGVVFKARHHLLDRTVALKVISQQVFVDDKVVQRFVREIRAVAALNHPHIIKADDAGVTRGVHYLAMEFGTGRDLGSWFAAHGPLPMRWTAECMLQAAEALHYAHQQGIVHRDVKPSNLLVAADSTAQPPNLKLLDLGLARFLNHAQRTIATRTGQVLGTIDYIAPEQCLGNKQMDGRVDVFSLGATFFHLLCGSVPFPGQTVTERLFARQTREAVRASTLRPQIPPALDKLIAGMLVCNRDRRYPTMEHVIRGLQSMRADLPNETLAAPAPPTVETSRDTTLSICLEALTNEAETSEPDAPDAVATTGKPAPKPARSGLRPAADLRENLAPAPAAPAMLPPADPEPPARQPAAALPATSSPASTPQEQPTAKSTTRQPKRKQPQDKTPAGPPPKGTQAAPAGRSKSPAPAQPSVKTPTPGKPADKAAAAGPKPAAESVKKAESPKKAAQPSPGKSAGKRKSAAKAKSPAQSKPPAPAPQPQAPRPGVAKLGVAQRLRSVPVLATAGGVLVVILGVLAYGWLFRDPVVVLDWPTDERDHASLRIDGQVFPATDESPLRISLSPGEHHLIIHRRGYDPVQWNLELATNDEEPLRPQWKSLPTLLGRDVWRTKTMVTVAESQADFNDLDRALADLQAFLELKSLPGHVTIEVTDSRTYELQAEFHAEGMDGLTLKATAGATLVPKATRPIVAINNIRRGVQVIGFQLDCQQAEQGIVLRGRCDRVRLDGLQIRNFKQAGVSLKEIQADSATPCELVRLTLSRGAAEADGIRLEREAFFSPAENVFISQCLFLGPLAGGVRVQAKTDGLEISRCRFADCAAGISLENLDALQTVRVLNNTFYQGQHGVVWTALPRYEVQIQNNLFLDLSGAEGRLPGFAPYKYRAVSHNVTSRAQPAADAAEIVGERNPPAELQAVNRSTDDLATFLRPPPQFKKLGTKLKVYDASGKQREIEFVGAIEP